MILHAIRMGESGPPVLLLHGLFGTAANWGRIQRALATTHRVIALDARNHGSSPHAGDVSYAALAADVRDTLAAEGLDRVAVVGHSMGGKIAMRLALDHPALVSRLVVADIAPVPYPPRNHPIAAAMLALPLHAGLTRAAAHAALADAVPDPVVRGFLLQNLRFGDPPAWRIGLAEIAAGIPAVEDWGGGGQYPGPVLVLRGELSDFIRPEHRAVFRALFPAARFASLRGAGHWLHADAPEAFLGTVAPFLA